MGVVQDAFTRAAGEAVTTPLPRGAPARMRHLVKSLGSVPEAARLLGTSPSTVRRYMRGLSHTPRPALADALERELRRRWKPGLRRAALRRAAQQGLTIETRARFGYSAPGGSTDEARIRLLTQYLPPPTARALVDAYRGGAAEETLQHHLAAALAYHYFRDHDRRADGLEITFGDIDYLDVEL